jgi:hypothetical protein
VPYIIRPPRSAYLPRLHSCAAAAFAALLLFGGATAQADVASSETEACQDPELFQPFLSAKDSHNYMLAPGQSDGSFNGEGWTLSGGASIVSATLPSGGTGSVLDLPSGSQAVSPLICAGAEYPTARTMVRNVHGSEGVHFNVAYKGTHSWEKPTNAGQLHGNHSEWTLSSPVSMHPENLLGWQLVKITLTGEGRKSDFQVDNLYIDPYARR